MLAVASDSGGKDESQNIRSGKRVTVGCVCVVCIVWKCK